MPDRYAFMESGWILADSKHAHDALSFSELVVKMLRGTDECGVQVKKRGVFEQLGLKVNIQNGCQIGAQNSAKSNSSNSEFVTARGCVDIHGKTHNFALNWPHGRTHSVPVEGG
jgi:hypothetical protein